MKAKDIEDSFFFILFPDWQLCYTGPFFFRTTRILGYPPHQLSHKGSARTIHSVVLALTLWWVPCITRSFYCPLLTRFTLPFSCSPLLTRSLWYKPAIFPLADQQCKFYDPSIRCIIYYRCCWQTSYCSIVVVWGVVEYAIVVMMVVTTTTIMNEWMNGVLGYDSALLRYTGKETTWGWQ